jgi:hypothetical protein
MKVDLKTYTSYFIYPEMTDMHAVIEPLQKIGLCCGQQTSLKSAIYEIIRLKPKIIFIALDHPQCRWLSFQTALENSYSCFVIPFVSKSTVATNSQIKMTYCEFKVAPPNTSENFVKIIKKVMLSQIVDHKKTRYERNENHIQDQNLEINNIKTIENLTKELPSIDVNLFENQYGEWPNHPSPFSSQIEDSMQAQMGREDEFYKKLSSVFAEENIQFFDNPSTNMQSFTQMNEVKKANCIAIQSDLFTGHLLTTAVDESKVDEKILDRLNDKIFNFFKAEGGNLYTDEKLKLDIRSVHFKDWAKEDAKFFKGAVINDTEVSIGFFPEQNVKIDIQDTENPEMSKVSLSDLEPMTTIGADLYLHLPFNQKYIHYVPEGSYLHEDVKNRLLTKGVTHLHFHNRDKYKFKKSLVEHKVNKKIDLFNAKKESETPAAV